VANPTTLILKHRSPGGAAGAPAALKSGELAYNMVDGYFYVGFGDDGAGNATSIKIVSKDDFNLNQRVPSGGNSGQVLARNGSGVAVWVDPPQTGSILVEGNGIDITDNVVSVDTSVVATNTSVATAIATKANVSHTHSASDITSGVFDVARIPVLPSQTVQVSSGTLANLTTAQQNAIVQGTVVTTTDGNRYVYNTGTKTLAASYIQLADITPEWSVIANKPSFATIATSGAYSDLSGKPALATVATSGSYTDLSNKPTLGSMAAQDSANVSITGGSISGVTIDGGTF